MARIIVMAFIVGITSGVGIGSLAGGPHIEGAMMGLTSIGLIATIFAGVYLFDKKRIANIDQH